MKQRAKFIYEFQRGMDPKDSMDIGRNQMKGRRLRTHIKNRKKNRSDEEIEYEKNVKTYVFLAKKAYKPVEVNGKTYHEEYLEIENLYQIDKYDKSDLMAVKMMKIRSNTDSGLNTWIVDIPVFMHNSKTAYNDEIDDNLREWIDEHKERI